MSKVDLKFKSRLFCWIASVLLTATIILYTTSCSRKPAPTIKPTKVQTSEQKTRKRKIVFVMKLVGIPYTNACEKGMKKAAAELGIEASFLGPPVPLI